MATYNLTSVSMPTTLEMGDILNCPYTGNKVSITLPAGRYCLECWGAQGGYRSSTEYGGKGGYSKGILTLEEYVDIVVDQLELLPQEVIIERLTGDGIAKDLIEPKWTIKKTIVTNEIDKLMVKRNTWQGKHV